MFSGRTKRLTAQLIYLVVIIN